MPTLPEWLVGAFYGMMWMAWFAAVWAFATIVRTASSHVPQLEQAEATDNGVAVILALMFICLVLFGIILLVVL